MSSIPRTVVQTDKTKGVRQQLTDKTEDVRPQRTDKREDILPQGVECFIPRTVFQTDKTRDVRPQWVEGPPSLKTIGLPGWKYEFYDDSDIDALMKTHFQKYYKFWSTLPYPIMKVDFFRYARLYHDGGFYSDLDYKYLKSLEHFFYNDKGEPTEAGCYVVKSKINENVFSNSIMASRRKHPFWLYLMDYCMNYATTHNTKIKTIMEVTGPRALDKCAKKWNAEINGGERPKHLLITPFPSNVNACNICEVGDIKEGAYTTTLEGQSWASPGEKMLGNFFCFANAGGIWFVLGILVFVVVVAIIILIRKKKVHPDQLNPIFIMKPLIYNTND